MLEETRPWLGTMFAVDDAERRGDARAALELMSGRMLGPDGRQFWRPSRVDRLSQVAMLGPALPRWAVSRWIVAQAHGNLGGPRDQRRKRCQELAMEVRGGLHGLSAHGETDARCKLMDRDWVYRQLFLYEMGGLSDFVRRCAAPDLLAGADHIHDWARAPMEALRLVERAPGTVTWERVESEERLELPNIGSAAMVVPGEHVLGRLVPFEEGVMLEATPLVVPEPTARRVARDPSSWMDAVAEAREDLDTSGFEHGVVSDVREVVWQLALHEPGRPVPATSELDAYLARRALVLGRECLDGRLPRDDDDLDPWACLRAALLSQPVVARLPSVAKRSDIGVVDELSGQLASPADVVCRDLARELGTTAA